MNAEQRRIHTYLQSRLSAGDRYFRAREIARELSMTPRSVGANLRKLSTLCRDMSIRRWARSVSITWYVVPVHA